MSDDVQAGALDAASQNEPVATGQPETNADVAPASSSAGPPAGDQQQSMEDAIREGLSQLSKSSQDDGQQPKGREERGGVAEKKDVDPGAKDKDDTAPRQKKDDLYRMPGGLAKESQQRFQRLVADNKRLEAELSKATEAANQAAAIVTGFRNLFRQNNVEPQELDTFLSYVKALKTGDYRTAESVIRAQIRALERATGKRFDAGDPLADYPDLRSAVDDMLLSEEHALELAAARSAKAAAAEQHRKAAQEARMAAETRAKAEAWAAAKDKALEEIRAFADEMAAKDIDFPAKNAIILKKVGQIIETYPMNPEKWPQIVRDYYETISEASAVGGQQRQARGEVPLRSGGTGGSGTPSPGNDMLATIKAGLGYK